MNKWLKKPPPAANAQKHRRRKRRQDFREKGQVAQSKEVHTAALFTISLAFWIFYLPTLSSRFYRLYCVDLAIKLPVHHYPGVDCKH